MDTMRRTLVVAVVATASLLVASSAAGAATTAEGVLKAGRLRQSDLPNGWLEKASKDKSSIDTDELMKDIPACSRTKKALKGEARTKSKSPGFEKGDNEISNSVNAYGTLARAKSVMGVTRRRSLRTCFALLFEKEMKQVAAENDSSPVEIKDVDVSSGSIDVPKYGDGSSGVTFKVAIDAGITINLYYTLVFSRVGKYVAVYDLKAEEQGAGMPALNTGVQATVDRLVAAAA
jgi:hypothetical protein